MKVFDEENIARVYYQVKPFLSRRSQIMIRSIVARAKRRFYQQSWPIDERAAALPTGWSGWPRNKRFSVVLTHDVDTAQGLDKTEQLMMLEKELGFVSSFNFVAQGYKIPGTLFPTLISNGFEIGVHGLEHSRKMYESRATFAAYASEINAFLKAWGAVGFRSPCMYHNYDWMHALDILYDASSFDTDPFEPQSDGINTIFPACFAGKMEGDSFVELPYTLPQDFTLFILLKEQSINVWKEKLRWIAEHGGMALINTHPDYMSFSGKPRFEEYPASFYSDFLEHLKTEYRGQYWHVLPKEVAAFWSRTPWVTASSNTASEVGIREPSEDASGALAGV